MEVFVVRGTGSYHTFRCRFVDTLFYDIMSGTECSIGIAIGNNRQCDDMGLEHVVAKGEYDQDIVGRSGQKLGYHLSYASIIDVSFRMVCDEMEFAFRAYAFHSSYYRPHYSNDHCSKIRSHDYCSLLFGAQTISRLNTFRYLLFLIAYFFP